VSYDGYLFSGQSQEEFYFSLPLDKMDLCLYGKNSGSSREHSSGNRAP